MIAYVEWEYDKSGLPEVGYIKLHTIIESEKIRVINYYRIDRIDGDDLRDGEFAKWVNDLCDSGGFFRSGNTDFFVDRMPCKTIKEKIKL
jgi:hypothetical protein